MFPAFGGDQAPPLTSTGDAPSLVTNQVSGLKFGCPIQGRIDRALKEL